MTRALARALWPLHVVVPVAMLLVAAAVPIMASAVPYTVDRLVVSPGIEPPVPVGSVSLRLPDSRLSLDGLTAAGSAAALEGLAQGDVDLALVQEDHLRDWLVRQPPSERPAVGTVARLYSRPLHLLVREPLYLEGVEDLAGLRVVLGPDADARATLRTLLDRVGLPARRMEAACDDAFGGGRQGAASPDLQAAERLGDCFRQGELDVALLLGSPGDTLVDELLKIGVARPTSLDYRTLRLLRQPAEQGGPFFAVTLGKSGAGTGEEAHGTGPVRTLAVPVLLAARRGLPAEQARAVAQGFQEALRARHDPSEILLPPDSLTDSDLPLAGGWFDGSHVRADGLWVFLSILPIAAVLALLLSFLARSRFRLVRRLRQSLPLLVILVLVPSAIVLVTLATYVAEHRYNEHFSSPAESFWSITVYLFSGLEDRSPYTPAGKAAAAVGLLLGPVLFTVATGWVASRFIHWERKMPKNLENHYLLLNWNHRGLQAVRQIHHPVIVEAEGTGVIVVLTDDPDVHRQLERDGMGSDPYFEDLFISIGDPTHERALLNVNAQDTRSVLVLADERLGEHADERTVRALFMLRKIAREKEREDLHVVAEIVNPANQVVCDQMAEDFPGLLEYVSRGEIRSCLLAQATLHGGMVRFYKDLLTVSGDTNELYVLPVPDESVGLTFREYAARVLAEGLPLVPIGVQRRDGQRRRLTCNPREEGGGAVLRSGDELVVLAYEPPRAADLPRPTHCDPA